MVMKSTARGRSRHGHRHRVGLAVDLRTGLAQPLQRRRHEHRIDALDPHRAAGDGRRVGPGPADHPVADRAVGGRVQHVDTLDGDGRGAGAGDLGAHLVQQHGQVDDLRLPGGVVDHRGAVGENRRHQDVLGGADAGEVQPDRGAAQHVGAADHLAVLDVHGGAHRPQARTGACPAAGNRSRRRPAARPPPAGSGPSAARARTPRRAAGRPPGSRHGRTVRPAW